MWNNKPLLFAASVVLILVIVTILVQIKKARNDRGWQDEFKVMADVTIEGDTIHFQNLRDWRYESDKVTSQNYKNESYDLNNFQRMWFVSEPFSRKGALAHTYFVFDFSDKEPLVFSVEARREKGEDYNGFLGLFRKYELIYVWGTEPDLTGKRVIKERNPIHMYEVKVSQEFGRNLMTELARSTQDLAAHPRFYNTVTSNCTNNLADFANKVSGGKIPFHYGRYFTGFSAKLLYDLGYLDSSVSFEALSQKTKINAFVEANYQDASLSAKLREELFK